MPPLVANRVVTPVEEEEIPKIEVEEIREEEQDTKPCPEGEQWCSIKKKCIKPE